MTPWLPSRVYNSSASKLALALVAFAASINSNYAQTENVIAGGSLVFSASADGFPSPTFQWRKDGAAIAGATGVMHTLPAVTAADAGTYTVLASNDSGSAASPALVVIVAPIVSVPVITTQPATQNLSAGSTATFTVAASGSPSFQWQKNGVAIPQATAPTLTLTNVTASENGTYIAVATNSAGSSMSQGAALVVATVPNGQAPVFTVHPVSQRAMAGSSLTLTAAATGTPAPSIQWLRDGSNIAGATTATLEISAAMNVYDGVYTAVASNATGTVTSSAAVINVGNPAPVNIKPEFTLQPIGQTATVGDTVTLTVAATGTPSPTFQWRKDGGNVAGATNATLTLASVSSLQSGAYTAVATNAAGPVTSAAATVTIVPRVVAPVNVAPAITTQPAPQTAVVGGSVTFTVAATGTPAPTFQWLKGGSAIAGATNSSLALAALTTAQGGNYSVVATNAAGSVTSAVATLTVTAAPSSNTAPVITTQPVSQTAAVGVDVTFTVAASGTPAPTFQWRKNGANISGATSASYTVSAQLSLNGASYSVVVKNKSGTVTSAAAILTVPKAPQITGQPESQTVMEGRSVTFVVNPASYQWFKDGVAIPGATSGAYQIGTVLGVDAGNYTVVITSAGGSVTSSPALLTVSHVSTTPNP